jgi:hypothetical protein
MYSCGVQNILSIQVAARNRLSYCSEIDRRSKTISLNQIATSEIPTIMRADWLTWRVYRGSYGKFIRKVFQDCAASLRENTFQQIFFRFIDLVPVNKSSTKFLIEQPSRIFPHSFQSRASPGKQSHPHTTPSSRCLVCMLSNIIFDNKITVRNNHLDIVFFLHHSLVKTMEITSLSFHHFDI